MLARLASTAAIHHRSLVAYDVLSNAHLSTSIIKMLAARRASFMLARRQSLARSGTNSNTTTLIVLPHQQPVAIAAAPSPQLLSRGYYAVSYNQVLEETAVARNPLGSIVSSWWSRTRNSPAVVAEWMDWALWQMSSTLKKRRAKMNKHKYRKRRKKLRKKTRKQ